MHRCTAIATFVFFLVALPVGAVDDGAKNHRQEVEEVERAFARTMAERDHEGFTTFLSEETIFISGPAVLRGKQAVAEAWKAYFLGPAAPFSWEPETVEVLDSGELALSSGPVYSAAGDLVATYTSIWRQEAPGVWRIVLDKGNQACPPAPVAAEPETSDRSQDEDSSEPSPDSSRR